MIRPAWRHRLRPGPATLSAEFYQKCGLHSILVVIGANLPGHFPNTTLDGTIFDRAGHDLPRSLQKHSGYIRHTTESVSSLLGRCNEIVDEMNLVQPLIPVVDRPYIDPLVELTQEMRNRIFFGNPNCIHS